MAPDSWVRIFIYMHDYLKKKRERSTCLCLDGSVKESGPIVIVAVIAARSYELQKLKW